MSNAALHEPVLDDEGNCHTAHPPAATIEARRAPQVQAVASMFVLGTPIALINKQSFFSLLDTWMSSRAAKTEGTFICFRDVHGVVRALDDPELAEAHTKAFLNVPDGMPLVWIGRRRGSKEIDRVCGPDMLPAVCRYGVERGWRHVFVGGTPDTLGVLTERLSATISGLVISDMISPPFRALDDRETEALLERIRRADPHFVWVGLGSPKQELWMAKYADRIPGAISMGIGAAFDIHAGRIPRAPTWLRRSGLEWLYRVVQEPRRLTQRYIRVIPRFLIRLIGEELSLTGHR